jgi:threonine dehydratase
LRRSAPEETSLTTLRAPRQEEIEQARQRISGIAVRTPLVRLKQDGPGEIYCKLEQLQPIGSFKIRCGANALLSMPDDVRRDGVVTASAGNFAQGLGYAAKQLGVRVTSVVPDSAAKSKLQALEKLGVALDVRPYADWWRVMEAPGAAGFGANFVHPVMDPAVLAGNATIGLELIEDLPSLATVLVPYGGGGLAVGIAAAVKAHRPDIRVFAVETEAAMPVAAAFAAGEPVTVGMTPSFVTGMGSRRVLDPMWPLVRTLLDGSVSTTLAETAAAIRLLVELHHVVAEGAGAAPVAAALAGCDGPTVCIISGGHLDTSHLQTIIAGGTP